MSAKIIPIIPAITNATITPMINSLLFPDEVDLTGVESRIHTSFSRIVPVPQR